VSLLQGGRFNSLLTLYLRTTYFRSSFSFKGCGVHVHGGTSCESTALQGGHLFAAPVTSDPWVDERYTSDATGYSDFGATVDIGATGSLAGKPFIVHAENGTRVGCGLLVEQTSPGGLLAADTAALTDAGVTGAVTVYPMSDGKVCYFGYSPDTTEPDLLSVLVGGTNCTATNGCGAHIHEGTSCANATEQLGHFYNKDTLTADPWIVSGYISTDSAGLAYFSDCVDTDESDYDGRAFIIHANDGSRVSCGLLAPVDDTLPTTAPAKVPTAAPNAAPTPTDAPTASPVTPSCDFFCIVGRSLTNLFYASICLFTFGFICA